MELDLERGILSDNSFHEDSNSLNEFLEYCYNNYSVFEISLEKRSHSFLLRVLTNGREDNFRKDELGETLLATNNLTHPFLILVSELCHLGHSAFVQNDLKNDEYRVSITPCSTRTEISYVDTEFCEHNLQYGVSFDEGVSAAWRTIRDFLDSVDEDAINYYVRDRTGERVEENLVQ